VEVLAIIAKSEAESWLARFGNRVRVGGRLFDYRLENDARFLARVEKARESVRAGQGVRLEDLEC